MTVKREILGRLSASLPAILPSMLLCDFGNLERELERLRAAGVQCLHLDIMDGVFVPNFTYGMTVVRAFRSITDMLLDCHLMMVSPGNYIDGFRDAGADVITVHQEAVSDLPAIARQIRDSGALAGVAINPGTPVSAIGDSLDQFDLALVMSVEAGFGGQSFQPAVLEKLRGIRELAPDILLEIDGGVSTATIAECAAAGAQLLVAGSAIFRSTDYRDAVDQLQLLARGAVAR